MKTLFAVCMMLALVTTTAFAGVLLSEPFSYTNGSLVTASAGVWGHHSGSTTGEVDVVASRVFLTQNETEDVSTILTGQPYGASATVFLYAGFILNVSNTPSGAGDYFAHYKASGASGAQRGKIFVTANGVTNGFYKVGIANGANSPDVLLNVNLSYNTDYFIVTRFVPSNSVTTVWLNPNLESDPSITAVDSATTINTVAFALRQTTGIGGEYLDNLTLATTFAEALAGSPPTTPPSITTQPQSQTVPASANVTFTVLASGTAPLSYQWKSNNVTVTGATNDTLTLLNVTTNYSGSGYSVTITNLSGSTNSDTATLTVTNSPPPPTSTNGTLTVVQYNVKGNFASDWTTNAPQVQAIARQLQYLNPDIITLNEIPNGFKAEMANWMIAFFPGYYLAYSTNNNTDDSIRNGVISRYAIIASNSWLGGSSLTNFGYNGTFTRDLFSVQVSVPSYPQPLHVFCTHLKSGTSSSDDAARRAAEASSVSNFFANVWLPTNTLNPYFLNGDMNEDINFPATGSQQPIQRLTNGTGLFLTTPINPFSLTNFTHSIQGTLGRRYDYMLPNALLYSNIRTSQVFRTDLLNPVPLNLNSNDDIVASDHLPVVMVFNNPYEKPFQLLSLLRSNLTVTLKWESVLGQPYLVESSSNLTGWDILASNLVATGTNYTFSTNLNDATRFFRVYRLP